MKYRTSDVFGVKSKLVESYVERREVDQKFKHAIKDGNEVVVYGSSKQGKTSLILSHLKQCEYVKVECSPNTQPVDIYRSILRQSNIKFTESESRSQTEESGSSGGFSCKIKVPVIGEVGGKGEISATGSESIITNTRYIEYNLALAQDVSELLKSRENNGYIVLENFHYLSIASQEALAYDLRAFQDQHVIFIILGIWREANRLVQFNGDLLDRIAEVPVEPWSNTDFRRVMEKGQRLLNCDFSNVMDKIVGASFDSVGVVQEICKQSCLEAGVSETASSLITIREEHVDTALSIKAAEYGVRHIRNFESFAEIVRRTSNQSGKVALAYPYYFIQILLTRPFNGLQDGLSRGLLLEEIRKIHHRPEDVRSSDLGNFLKNITQTQISRKIQPPFVDYDSGAKLVRIIDSSLYFFLKHCNRQEILDDLPELPKAEDVVR